MPDCARKKRSRYAEKEFLTSWYSGPPYIEKISGYFLLLSKPGGSTHIAGKSNPSSVGIVKSSLVPRLYSSKSSVLLSAMNLTDSPEPLKSSSFSGWFMLL